MSLYTRIIDLQKLQDAWGRVRKNKPAAGVDHVTCEQFDAISKQELKQLYEELNTHSYEPLPVKRITLYRGDKARDIVLHAMRDKVVQQSVSAELCKIYDHLFSPRCIAYRPNQSALNAVQEISERILSEGYGYALKIDISK